MNQNINLYTKTKQILDIKGNENQEKHIFEKNQNQYNSFPIINDKNINNFTNDNNDNNNNKDDNNNNNYDNYNMYSLENKYILQKNNEKLINLNKSIKEDKEKLLNILSPIKSEKQKEDVNNQEYHIYPTLNYLNNIKSIYNVNSKQLQKDFINMKNKKNKLVLVYNSLYNFKQKLLNKEKEIKEKESKINKYENIIKTNENILKNNLEAFNNYINYQTQSLINKFKNIKNFHEQKEDELKLREQKINEYETIIRNIIQRKELENKEKLIRCVNIGEQIEEKLGIDIEKIKQKEKEAQIIQDYKKIEEEKEQIEKDKELLQIEREKILMEKKQNIKYKKRNDKLAKKLKQKELFIKQNNSHMTNIDYNINNLYNTPLRDECNSGSNIFDKFYSDNNSINNGNNNYYITKKALTPMVYHSSRYKTSNPYRNQNFYNKDDSFISYQNISNNNLNSMQIGNDQIHPIKKNSKTYVHDNIYLLKNRRNNLNNFIPKFERPNSSRFEIKRNLVHIPNNSFTNRTINLLNNKDKNNINYNTENINIENPNNTFVNENKSKYLEIKSNDNLEDYKEINKQLFEAEKALQLMKSQENKIKIIKNKLDKKMKKFS